MLKAQIESEITRALRTRDALRLSVFRMLSAAIHNREIEERTKRGTSELTEDNVVQVVRAELKKRREAEVAYAAGGRTEAAAQERPRPRL
ncbi:MAG: GatB/YqeY domain-containing protein [Pseudomonadota bacterium]